ncbi:MAG TPA: MFS transporter [Actinomycetota bacterium]|nr:MFS transporter [Actinomycetota bacterium]
MIRRGPALLFGRRDFGLLMGAQWAAQAGDGIVQAALAKFIVFGGQRGFDLEGAKSPDELLRIALYIFVPYTVLSPFLGVVIDRWDRRRLLFVANGLRAVVVLLIGLVGTGAVGDVGLFSAFLLTLSSTRIVLATKSAALPETVDATSLVEANAVSQLGGAMFQLVGGGAGFVATKFVAVEPVVIAGALIYAVGAAVALGIERAGEARSKDSFVAELAGVAGRIASGVREVARTPRAAAAILTYFWLRLLWSYSLVAIGFVARELVSTDLLVLVITGGAGAFGAVLGYISAQRAVAVARSPGRVVIAASLLLGGAVVALGALQSKWALGLLTFFLGFGFFLAKISLDGMVQTALEDGFRGRAFSLYDIAYNLAWVVSAAVLKLLWGEGAQGLLIAGMGVVFLIGVGGIALWFNRAALLSPASATAR